MLYQTAKAAISNTLRPFGFDVPLRSAWRQVENFGARYRCPMCGEKISAFFPGGEQHPVLIEKSVIGGGPRANVTCPVCYSVDRERLLFLFLTANPNMLSGNFHILHLAPEAKLREWLSSQQQLHYTTADLNMPGVDHHFDLTDIPIDDCSFDGIICNHVLEHVGADEKAMAELFRILKPGGWAILQVPISRSLFQTCEDPTITDPRERERLFGQDDHVRIYGPDYVKRLQNAGFSVGEFDWRSEPQKYGGVKNSFGLIDGEVVFLATRPSANGYVAWPCSRDAPASILKR